MWLSDSYEVPQELIDNPPSPEFRQFLLDWFGSNRVESIDRFRSATCLAPAEMPLARELMRCNLKTRRVHIINGTWILGDRDAIPVLRTMFGNELEESRRLTIAGALWKLDQDPVLIECLNRASGTLLIAHLEQVLWLNDERALDFLIDRLPENDDDPSFRRKRALGEAFSHTPLRRIFTGIFLAEAKVNAADRWVLGMLNRLETGRHVHLDDFRPASYYRQRRNDPEFRALMVEAVRKAAAAPPRL